ncbi:hypothetical protein D9758_018585 [Tetrapyrgos nigripes]|uniref:Uncharacterized protein n=1 Tax=Tetrapyrgos nigripes TaxID=182062 RepID=A0A8H5BRD2_9AGAR|nr:hypothetical protein D9758_018585 [Tetrapyrgos nigripes]
MPSFLHQEHPSVLSRALSSASIQFMLNRLADTLHGVPVLLLPPPTPNTTSNSNFLSPEDTISPVPSTNRTTNK